MKKTIIVIATFGGFSAAANAQSSVTLYGIIDEGFNINTNSGGAHLYNLSSSVLNGNRFGVRGVEDIGGGVNAVFVLENGFDGNTGKLAQGNLLFGRQAFVGLSSSSLGSLTMGRQYDSLGDFVGPLQSANQWAGYISAHPDDYDNLNFSHRSNSTVKYTSVNYAGLKFGGMYSFGGVAGNFSQNQAWALGASYNTGSVSLAVGYLNARTPNNFGGLLNNGADSAPTSGTSMPVYGGFASARTYQVVGAGGTYTLGGATFGVTYSNTSFRNLGATGTTMYRVGENATFNNVEANFKYWFSPTLLAGVAFDYTSVSSVALAAGGSNEGAKYYQYMVGLDYFLSKRTDIYTIGVYQHASGINSNNQPAVASLANLTPSSNSNVFTMRFGIRHKF
ncbi:porin [Paraburkholderia caribensis]|uniref:porin n=1 Tax=Paraburkholderia caribensis TaxID=75105 RepID=UPI001CC416DA|nr:porin [Paraburkholderia caribensis]